MLEPDVALTDLILAAQCAVFSVVLFRRDGGQSRLPLLFAWLFVALGLSSLFGGVWHGMFSASGTAAGSVVWFLTMAALAAAAAVLWLIAGVLVPTRRVSSLLPVIAVVQFGVQISISAFVTDSFAVAAVGLLPPLATVFILCVDLSRSTGAAGTLYAALGFALAALAGLIIVFDLSLHPRWATTHAVYHIVHFVAFWFVFRSVPTLVSVAENRNGGLV